VIQERVISWHWYRIMAMVALAAASQHTASNGGASGRRHKEKLNAAGRRQVAGRRLGCARRTAVPPRSGRRQLQRRRIDGQRRRQPAVRAELAQAQRGEAAAVEGGRAGLEVDVVAHGDVLAGEAFEEG